MHEQSPQRPQSARTDRKVLRTTMAAALPAAAVLLILSAFLTSCAVMEAPPGGPVDEVPPFVTFVQPDSGSTDVGPVKHLRIAFSEKMDRQPATSWLYFFPDQRVRKTSWKGARVAEIELEEPLPADTTVVIEIAGGMRDAHRVQNRKMRRFPLATGAELAAGSLTGKLMLEDEALQDGIVELYPLQPDSLEYFQRPLARRTQTNEMGVYRFDWLPVPGGPWVARAFQAKGGSLRPQERSPQRLMPDTLCLDLDTPQATVETVIVYNPDTPGRMQAGPFAPHPRFAGSIAAFTLAISENDTGYTAYPPGISRSAFSFLEPDSGGTVHDVRPGHVRLVAFVDVNADSTFSSVPDTLLGPELAALTDTVAWYMEPWALLDGIDVLPGMSTDFIMPVWPDTLTPGPVAVRPPAAPADTLATDQPDTTTIPTE